MEYIYSTEIREPGPEASGLPEMGVFILSQTGAYPEWAELDVVHEPSSWRGAPPKVVDVVAIEFQESRTTSIGGKAWPDGWEPGYAVFEFTDGEEVEQPGGIYLEGSGSKKLGEIVRLGARTETKAVWS